jgi:16S rRNA (uracil1498-N3)-methyltransferase
VTFRTLEKLAAPAPTVRLVLCAALIKFDHFEWMIEKATELGVSEIVPVETIRSERGLERAAHKRVERWRRIALEASQQSRRAFLPDVSEPESLGEALDREANYKFALDENPTAQPLNVALPPARDPQDTVAMLIGPEGGWTEDERGQFIAAGWSPDSSRGDRRAGRARHRQFGMAAKLKSWSIVSSLRTSSTARCALCSAQF